MYNIISKSNPGWSGCYIQARLKGGRAEGGWAEADAPWAIHAHGGMGVGGVHVVAAEPLPCGLEDHSRLRLDQLPLDLIELTNHNQIRFRSAQVSQPVTKKQQQRHNSSEEKQCKDIVRGMMYAVYLPTMSASFFKSEALSLLFYVAIPVFFGTYI